MTPEQVKAYRLMDNRSHQETSWDEELLGPELFDLKGLDFDLSLTGFDSAEIDSLLADATHLHLSGYVLLDAESRPAGIAMLAAARAAGLTTSVDPQAAALLTDPTGFLAAIDGVDLLLPNTAELAALTGAPDPASANTLLGNVGAVALTRGPDGACWIDRNGIVSVPADPVDSVDTTGAGDAFDAATLINWLAGAAPSDVLRAGVAAGSSAVTRLGAQPVSRR